MALRLITDATAEPVSVEDMLDQLRLSTSTSDGSSRDRAVIPTYTKAARLQAENLTKRALAFEAWELSLDGFPSGGIEVPRPPISTQTSDMIITYLDSSDRKSVV